MPRRIAKTLALRLKRAVARPLRLALVRLARTPPRSAGPGGDDRVTLLLTSAWGLGGTIRTTLGLAGHLARDHQVEVISVFRRRKRSFFPFPSGVEVTALDDQRDTAARPGAAGALQRFLRGRSSVLVHPAERHAHEFSLWTDLMLVHRLRRATGVVIATRPGLNLLLAELAPPGLVTIGQEHMPLHHHVRPLRRAARRHYPRLDAFTVLTEGTRQQYAELLDGSVRLERIPNAVPELEGPPADLSAKTILAAGRLVPQKGFDLLIPAFARVAEAHPDWRLRICGWGRQKQELEEMIEQRGLAERVTVAGTRNMGETMAEASIFAMSSRFEGFPMILLEAMSKGMGVVSFDCPTGPRDLIEPHANGILAPPQDVDALAAGMLELVEDEELRRRCGAAAAATSGDYRIEAIGRRWETLFGELRAARPGASAPRPPGTAQPGLEAGAGASAGVPAAS